MRLRDTTRENATLREALVDALARCTFLERRRDHWRAYARELEHEANTSPDVAVREAQERARSFEQDAVILSHQNHKLELELAVHEKAADEFKRRACELEKERDALRAECGRMRDALGQIAHASPGNLSLSLSGIAASVLNGSAA